MWRVEEHRRIDKQVAVLPMEIRKRYEIWQSIASMSGPPGLRAVRGFGDEALAGKWEGHRSCRLNDQYRVIYRLESSRRLFQVVELTAHDYRKR